MSKIYTPIATREILLLIRCKVEHRDEDFKETALRIADSMEADGLDDPAEFIRAQMGTIPTFVPM